ncbi:hypothetical protein PMIN06_012684 [Paraphaeosphaeria minitans]|uniref:MADS-box domain-containing protein n=1 Tax=Paraphaeosphaeria minitans TaxID=565426 RepID=A0A9P6G6W0_9PLEO|nr:hypothetical protein PMIN01_13618 [Paraphaeosphaeria minitans]KAF9729959.1 hypothetical protein PMIN01_11892 [Paraphaeosphaeria minitans]
MASPQQSQVLSHSKARRAANNNYLRLSKTLYKKLAKLCQEYDTHVYFLAYRNGRFNGFVLIDKTGQRWSPPGQETLDKLYPPPVIKSLAYCRRAQRRRAKVHGNI